MYGVIFDVVNGIVLVMIDFMGIYGVAFRVMVRSISLLCGWFDGDVMVMLDGVDFLLLSIVNMVIMY